MKKYTRNQKITVWAIVITVILTIVGWFIVTPKPNSQSAKVSGNNNTVTQNLQNVEVKGNNNITKIFMHMQGVEGNTKDAKEAIENDETIKRAEKESLLLFLSEMDNIPDETRKKFVENYLKDPEVFQYALQQITIPAQSVEKSSLIGKIFRKYIMGDLSYEEASKLSYMVNYAFWGDLQKFFLNRSLEIDDTNQSLVAARIFKVSVSGGGYRARYNPANIKYTVTEYGNKLFEIENGVD